LTLIEMEKNRDSALCCGGGGGNFYIDFLGGSADSPSRRRVREAYETGANVLAVACPTCLTMLEDALKSEELEGKLVVKDISEIVAEACGIAQ
jgi:Fe-S oxidoreductase